MLHSSQGFLKCGSWHSWGFPDGTVIKNLPASAGDTGDASLISGLGRFPNLGNGNALQYFCLENPMDRAACQAAVHPVFPPPCAFVLLKPFSTFVNLSDTEKTRHPINVESCSPWDVPHSFHQGCLVPSQMFPFSRYNHCFLKLGIIIAL